MLQRHNECTGQIAGKRAFAGFKLVVDIYQALSDAVTEGEDGSKSGPIFVLLRYLRMILRGRSVCCIIR